jgi:hypothetical protein
MSRSRIEYEAEAKRLVGKRLCAVSYFEINYESGKPFYETEGFPGHLLDFGCDLRAEDGSVWGVIWDGEYFQHGVGVLSESLRAHVLAAKSWDVSDDAHWKSHIGKLIVSVNVYWNWVQYEGSNRRYYPQDLGVEFEGGDVVYFSASQYCRESDTLQGISDDIAVLFGNRAAERYCVGPYASDG